MTGRRPAILRKGSAAPYEAAFCELILRMQDEKILEGICCEVENCVHNNGNCCCTAQEIKVKNRMAVLGEETMCETFEEV